jgi:SprT protein
MSIMSMQPLDAQQRQLVRDRTALCVHKARAIYALEIAPIEVCFDLRGTAAGMYRVRRGERRIRYNPWIFARYFEDSLAGTVPHEVAHYVTDCLYGLGRVPPHGAEWRAVMRALGAEPRATGCYDLSGLPLRRQQRFLYRCGCGSHQLSAVRHNRVQRGEAVYLCRQCRAAIRYAEAGPGR